MMGWYKEADRTTRRVFWTCSAGWALDTVDGLAFQYLIPLIVVAMGITLGEAATIASANYFAAAIGGWVGGWLCDRYGRARVLQITILWFSLFSGLSGFVQNFDQMLIVRILHGFGFGAEWAVGAVLLGERLDPKHRGTALGTVHSAAAIGSGIAALLAGPVAMMFPPDIGWRFVFWVGALPALLILFVRRGSDDAEISAKARAKAAQTGQRPSIVDIFRPNMIRITLAAALLAIGAQGAGFAISNYLTSFLANERGLGIVVAGYCVLANSAGGFAGFLTNAYLSDRLGRRAVFRLFALGFAVMAAIYLFGPWGDNLYILVPVGLVYGFFQFGIYASFGPYFTELFPTEMRGTGQAFAYNFGRAVSALFIMGVAAVAVYMPLSAAMATLAIAALCLAFIATLILPETAGRALTNLEDH